MILSNNVPKGCADSLLISNCVTGVTAWTGVGGVGGGLGLAIFFGVGGVVD